MPASAHKSLCRLMGGLGRSTMMASSTAANCETSCLLAPVTTSDNGTPRPSTSKWRLLPFFSPIRRVGTYALLRHWRLHHRPINALPSPGDAFKYQTRIFGLASSTALSGVGLIGNALTNWDQWFNTAPKLIGDFPCFCLGHLHSTRGHRAWEKIILYLRIYSKLLCR